MIIIQGWVLPAPVRKSRYFRVGDEKTRCDPKATEGGRRAQRGTGELTVSFLTIVYLFKFESKLNLLIRAVIASRAGSPLGSTRSFLSNFEDARPSRTM